MNPTRTIEADMMALLTAHLRQAEAVRAVLTHETWPDLAQAADDLGNTAQDVLNAWASIEQAIQAEPLGELLNVREMARG